jgi:hypothetical protein
VVEPRGGRKSALQGARDRYRAESDAALGALGAAGDAYVRALVEIDAEFPEVPDAQR